MGLLCGGPCHNGMKSKQQFTVLLACNTDGCDKLPLLEVANMQVQIIFRMLKHFTQNMMPIQIPG
jgi:hypothetical protein